MILYSDEYTRKLELEGKWIDCVRYSHEKLTADRKKCFAVFETIG